MARLFTAASTQHLLVAAAPVTAAPLTMACWFRANDVTTERCLMSISDGSGDNAWFRLDLRGDVGGDPICARARNGSGADARADTTAAYSTGTWQHACAVFTSSTSRTVYLNAANNATNTTSVTPSGLTTTTIGKRSSINSALMDGRIAYAALWNVALTAAEITLLSSRINPRMIRPLSLKGYWPLHGTSPEVDLSGQHNNMTVTGATIVDNPGVGLFVPFRTSRSYVVVATPPSTFSTRKILLGVGK